MEYTVTSVSSPICGAQLTQHCWGHPCQVSRHVHLNLLFLLFHIWSFWINTLGEVKFWAGIIRFWHNLFDSRFCKLCRRWGAPSANSSMGFTGREAGGAQKAPWSWCHCIHRALQLSLTHVVCPPLPQWIFINQEKEESCFGWRRYTWTLPQLLFF